MVEQVCEAYAGCRRCGATFRIASGYSGYCSAECALAGDADLERAQRNTARRWVWTLALLIVLCAALATVQGIRDTVTTNSRLERISREAAVRHRWELQQIKIIAAHERRMAPKFALQQYAPTLPVAAVSTPDGVSDKAFPTLRAFCEALRMEGFAVRRIPGKSSPEKLDAIDASFGAQLVPAGDVVEVVRDARTTCDGELQRLPTDISYVRDYRIGVSGWILSRHLTEV